VTGKLNPVCIGILPCLSFSPVSNVLFNYLDQRFPRPCSDKTLPLCYHSLRPFYVTLRHLLPPLPSSIITYDAGDSRPLTLLPVVPLGAPVPVPTCICPGVGRPPGTLPSPPHYNSELRVLNVQIAIEIPCPQSNVTEVLLSLSMELQRR